MESNKKPSFTRQALGCMAMYTLSMSIGAGTGFSGVANVELATEEHGFNMSPDQISWFTSLQTFAMVPTCFLGGLLSEFLGRKLTCRLLGPLFIIGNSCIVAAPDLKLLYFGRLLCGIGCGLACSPAGVYVSEISTPEWRTTFGAGLSSFYMVGTFLTYVFGKWMSWRALAGTCIVYPSLSVLLLSIVPESPAYLANQGRFTEAKKSLAWLRGPNIHIEQEWESLVESVKKNKLKSSPDNQNTKLKQVFSDFLQFLMKLKRPDVWKPLCIVISVMFLQQFTGISTIAYYAVSIMETAGSNLNKYTATIIYGLVRLVACFLGSWFVKKFKRRPLFILSSLSVAAGFALLGLAVYFLEKQEEHNPFLDILPLIAVNIIAVGYQAGLGPIPWSYTAELYPVDLRGILSGISQTIANLYIFLTLKTFPSVQESLTIPGSYWFFSTVAIGAAIFGATVLPDTQGKTLAEVSEYFYSAGCCSKQRKEEKTTLPVVENLLEPDGEKGLIVDQNEKPEV